MIKGRVFYAVFAAACISFSMIYTSKVTAVILLTVLFYPIAAAVLTALQAVFIKASFSEERISCDKNSTFEYYIDVCNKSVFPCAPLELICNVPDVDTGRIMSKRFYISLSPFASAKLSVEGKHIYRGYYTAEVVRISAVDPLRIIRISKKGKSRMTMVFSPRKFGIDDVGFSTSGDQDFSSPNISTANRDEFSHVREYELGENIQLVHWKLSAKQDELMIKQFDSVSDKRAFILCDWSGDDGDAYLRADTVIETTIAFANASLESGINLTALLGRAAENHSFSISNSAEFNRFFDTLAVLPVMLDASHEEFTELIDKTELGMAAAVILVTAQLSEEVLSRASELAQTGIVYLAYINLTSKPVDKQLYEEQFLFMNIRGSGEEALKLALAMAQT